MKKINVLHIAEIDNDIAKGTSAIIPYYIIEQSKNNNINVAFLNCNDNVINSLKKINNVYNINDNYNMSVINNYCPDIVVFHELYKPYYLKIYKKLLKEKIPYIIIPHGGMTKKAQHCKFIKKFFANLLLFNSFFKNARKIQYLSENEKTITNFPNINSYVLGNGISNIPNKNMYLTKKKSNTNKFSLIYVGRYDYYIKGLDQLLKAMKIIKDSLISDIILDLYGKGSRRDYNKIKKYINDNKLENIVKLNGPIFNEEKRNNIINCDVFIQVSRTEGQPLGVMEALCLGMPVILSKGTGCEKIIVEQNNGKVVKTNANIIADSIIYMMKNKNKLMFYSSNSYNYSSKAFSWETIVNKSIEEYKKVIRGD